MSHTSPQTFILWTISSCFLGIFVLYHLWNYDRFRCLKWNTGPYTGAFKRVMTYTYILGVPLVITFSMGFAIIKYNEGYIFVPQRGVIPKPYFLWDPSSQSAIFPLTLCFSVGWSLEMVTHLQELCFWLFLVNAASAQQDWFRSLYFKTWVIGSIIAIIYMPLVTIFTREDHLTNEAYTFLAGSLGSLSLTLSFLPVLLMFPSFLNNLKLDDVDQGTIVRLTKFHELNIIRILFRFMFTIPLLVLGVDGIRPHRHINESMFWTDLIAVLAGFGFVISSGITLVIFFPRSIEGEMAAKDRRRTSKSVATMSQAASSAMVDFTPSMMESANYRPSGDYPPMRKSLGDESSDDYEDEDRDMIRNSRFGTPLALETLPSVQKSREEIGVPAPQLNNLRPNRRVGSDVQLGGIENRSRQASEENASRHGRTWNPAVHNFTSPIDFSYASPSASRRVPVRDPPRSESRFTFNRV